MPETLGDGGPIAGIHVTVGPLEKVVGPALGREVLERGDAVGVQALGATLAMSDTELGAWVRGLLENAAAQRCFPRP